MATEHRDEMTSLWTRERQLLDEQEDDLRRRLDVNDLTDEQVSGYTPALVKFYHF
jgi:hypothetical protein